MLRNRSALHALQSLMTRARLHLLKATSRPPAARRIGPRRAHRASECYGRDWETTIRPLIGGRREGKLLLRCFAPRRHNCLAGWIHRGDELVEAGEGQESVNV